MAMNRLILTVNAAGCAMAPSLEDLDGPVDVMPRREQDLMLDVGAGRTEATALAVRWNDYPRANKLRGLVETYWYGRATPA